MAVTHKGRFWYQGIMGTPADQQAGAGGNQTRNFQKANGEETEEHHEGVVLDPAALELAEALGELLQDPGHQVHQPVHHRGVEPVGDAAGQQGEAGRPVDHAVHARESKPPELGAQLLAGADQGRFVELVHVVLGVDPAEQVGEALDEGPGPGPRGVHAVEEPGQAAWPPGPTRRWPPP